MAAAQSSHEFREKLVLSVLDKLVFGLLIVLAGFVLNLVLENYRSGHEVRAEIARLRVARVASVWEALDQQQRAIDVYGGTLLRDARRVDAAATHPRQAGKQLGAIGLRPEEVERQLNDLNGKQQRVLRLLKANRFWIGERVYPRYLAYEQDQESLGDTYEAVSYSVFLTGYPDAFEAFANLVQRAKRRLTPVERTRQDEQAFEQELRRTPMTRAEHRALRRVHLMYRNGLRKIEVRKQSLEEARSDVFKVMTELA